MGCRSLTEIDGVHLWSPERSAAIVSFGERSIRTLSSASRHKIVCAARTGSDRRVCGPPLLQFARRGERHRGDQGASSLASASYAASLRALNCATSIGGTLRQRAAEASARRAPRARMASSRTSPPETGAEVRMQPTPVMPGMRTSVTTFARMFDPPRAASALDAVCVSQSYNSSVIASESRVPL